MEVKRAIDRKGCETKSNRCFRRRWVDPSEIEIGVVDLKGCPVHVDSVQSIEVAVSSTPDGSDREVSLPVQGMVFGWGRMRSGRD